MTPERNPLDLNNLPEDNSRDGNNKQSFFEEGSSSTGHRRKKNGAGGEDGKDECGKVYECRFCSLKFCKSQALGGHMNRHRQERETESLNRARQLVYSNDNLAAAHGIPPPHLGGHTIGGDPTLAFRSVYPQPRLFPTAQPSLQPHPPSQINNQQQPSFLYNNAASPSRNHLVGFSSQYHRHPQINDFYVGHVLSTSHHHVHNNIINNNNPSSNNSSNPSYPGHESSYTCIGAPVGGPGFPPTGSVSMHNQEEVMNNNWNGRGGGYGGGMKQKCVTDQSSIKRFQDGF